MASSRRIVRVRELLREEIGGLLLKEFDLSEEALLTVTRIELSPKLTHAAVFVSIFPEKFAQKTLLMLEQKTPMMQRMLNRKLSMRPLPKIRFSLDRDVARADTVERILSHLQE